MARYINRGPVSIEYAQFTALQKDLTVTGATFTGKSVEYPVYKEQDDRFLVPRFTIDRILGIRLHTLIDFRTPATQNIKEPAIPLWEEQRQGVAAAVRVLEEEHGVFLNAKPGSGKTIAALHIVHQLKPHKVLIMVDQDNLADQWTERIRQVFPDETITYIMPLASQRALHKKYGRPWMIDSARRHDLRGRFIICMTQTLVAHPQPIDVDMLIVDECHVFAAPTFCQAVFNFTFTWSLGLSANTTRPDRLEWIFKDMLGRTTVVMEGKRKPARAFFYPVSTEHLTWDEPYPSPKIDDFRILWCKWHKKMTTKFDCAACPTSQKIGTNEPAVLVRVAGCVSFWRNDEFDENSLERHLSISPKYTSWLLDTLEVLLQDRRNVMVFMRLREPLERLHELLSLDLGDVSGLYLGASTTAEERARNAAALKKPITLCTYKKAGKGLDVADKDAIVFASPVSKGQLNQVVGRVERELAGKRNPVAFHAVIPFITSVARMRGCIRWYMEHGYETTIHPTLANHSGVNRH